METIMSYLPLLPSFCYMWKLQVCCVDDVSSKLDIQDVKRTEAFGKFDWFCHPRLLQPNLNQMQYNSVQYQQYAMQLCSSSMAACLYRLIARTVEIQACPLSLHDWSCFSFSSCCWQRCVYRRQSWKVAMLTGEEVYFSFHNFLQLYSVMMKN